MTREEIKELLPIMQAFAEGKTIQFRTNNRPWIDLLDNDLEINALFEYRIKPESNYRPFQTQEECWNEMLKHQPFGWLKDIKKQEKVHIGCVFEIRDNVLITLNIKPCDSKGSSDFFRNYTFADGTPFGIKEK